MFQFLKTRMDEPRWKEVRQSSEGSMKDGEDSTDSTDGLLGQHPPTSRWALRNHKTTIIYILLGLNMVWSLANLATFWHQHPFQRNHLLRRVSNPSPLFDKIDLGPKPRRSIGGLHGNGNIFRQPPSPEVDKAWSIAALDDYEVINVTKADLIAAGEDPDYAAMWEPGVDSYPAEVEFSHKIHCLDMIRKSIWGDHYWGNISIHADDRALARGDYTNDDEGLYDEHGNKTIKGERRMRRYHTMHCIHMILQDLQCNVDVGIIPIVWVKGSDNDENRPLQHLNQFSTVKQCRDYDAAMKWVKDNAVLGANEGYGTLEYHNVTKILHTDDRYDP